MLGGILHVDRHQLWVLVAWLLGSPVLILPVPTALISKLHGQRASRLYEHDKLVVKAWENRYTYNK